MSKQYKTAIISHTGSDMTLEYADKMGISLLSDIVVFGNEQFRTLRDIDSQTFFHRLETEKIVPTSSQPPLGAFVEAYQQAAAAGCTEILSVMVTARMSGSFATANTARTLLLEQGFSVPIYIYDSEQSSHGLDFLAAFAARRAQQGMSAPEIIAALDEVRPNVGIYFIFDSLRYVRRSGRIGAIRALAADVLGLRPILVFREGLVKDVGMSRRGYRDGIAQILSHYENEAAAGDEVIVFHSRMPEEAAQIAAEIRGLTPKIPIRFEGVGPVMGLYAGPKCIGITFLKRGEA